MTPRVRAFTSGVRAKRRRGPGLVIKNAPTGVKLDSNPGWLFDFKWHDVRSALLTGQVIFMPTTPDMDRHRIHVILGTQRKRRHNVALHTRPGFRNGVVGFYAWTADRGDF